MFNWISMLIYHSTWVWNIYLICVVSARDADFIVINTRRFSCQCLKIPLSTCSSLVACIDGWHYKNVVNSELSFVTKFSSILLTCLDSFSLVESCYYKFWIISSWSAYFCWTWWSHRWSATLHLAQRLLIGSVQNYGDHAGIFGCFSGIRRLIEMITKNIVNLNCSLSNLTI